MDREIEPSPTRTTPPMRYGRIGKRPYSSTNSSLDRMRMSINESENTCPPDLSPVGSREQQHLVTVIGRGNSGTRAASETLSRSGVYMGQPLNSSWDLVPPDDFYEACRVMGKHVAYLGNLRWDFSKLHSMPIDPEFTTLVTSYLSSVLDSDSQWRGWKLPETTLVFPWIVRLFPEMKYIFWLRDPRDSILGAHITDDLALFGVDSEHTEDIRVRRAISWKYQADLVKATPKPRNWHIVRFEDFVIDQAKTLNLLEQYLGIPLVRIPVRTAAVGRWRTDDGIHHFDFLTPDLVEHKYVDTSEHVRQKPDIGLTEKLQARLHRQFTGTSAKLQKAVMKLSNPRNK